MNATHTGTSAGSEAEGAGHATARDGAGGGARRIALVGNPNTGKTTLFNRISGLRHKTGNFPGTTLEAKVARVQAGVEGGRDADLIDLPGIYSLELEQEESRICREVLAGTAAPRGEILGSPDAVVIVTDATNLARNLMLVGEVLRRRLPTVVVVNMIDLASADGIEIDAAALGEALGCGVVTTSARVGRGVDELRVAIRQARIPAPAMPVPSDPEGLKHWAEEMFVRGVRATPGSQERAFEETRSDRVDRVLLHPVLGTLIFALVMTGLFYTIFSLAHFPMGWIEWFFERGAKLAEGVLPEGAVRDLVSHGVIGGVGATVVFLPQICLLFFLISVLEDTGYLARGAFLMDRLLRPFGLPGHAFVPLLSSHACALPGIMATRAIPDPKERLATILVAPFMTCSARLPVYVLLTTLLFKDRPAMAAVAFIGCYVLGITAGVLSALLARRTILKGKARPMAMELPCYKWPSLRTASLTTFDRGLVFLKKAGTNILVICIALWWLGAYPKVAPPAEAIALHQQVVDEIHGWTKDGPTPEVMLKRVEELQAKADHLEASHAKAHSFMGMIGRTVQPVFAPLNFDWQLTVGVMASFAAREVFVSTMAVVVAGEEDAEQDGVIDQIASAKRADGSLVFSPAASWGALVFFVLAMQCLPTLAVTARESGNLKWALLQLGWMSMVAYIAAFVVVRIMS